MGDEFETWVEPVKVRVGRPAPVTPETMDVDGLAVYTSIWFDPGVTTGWSVFSVWEYAMRLPNRKILANLAGWSAGQFTGTEAVIADQMMDLVSAWGEDAVLGWEDFILRKFTMGRELLSPVRISARFEDRLYLSGRTAQIQPAQQPALAMTSVTDERLKLWGFWNPLSGQQHARDAVKHNLTFLRRLKQVRAREQD